MLSLSDNNQAGVIEAFNSTFTVVPTKSDSYKIFCLQFLSKTFPCTPHLS